ncbi:MFS superfamily sulfate permease-like transporter [Edaphobacter aggregans]|uniref:MFS superfamily sulfate permease-like transporter n=1 Tax=Edaphobacter aggregans TaxID=570835 RepID=A0A428MP82_9BACT|nr:SulP family inorganic anion transporter [Edaphobacter aggregans]RSL18682.1 MFS superfamily sulfate permease-like transporter [Edaphobacter aggregans]
MNLFRGLRPLQRADAARGVLAGIVLAAMDIPQVLGYAKIAGMPLVTGLYSLLLPLVAFAAFGSSRYLVVAADSATAAIFASGMSGMKPLAEVGHVALAGVVALLTAGILLMARLLRLGFIADFLSRTVLVGFLAGVGLQVAISVLSEMLGVPVNSRRTVVQLWEVLHGLPRAHLPTLAVSATVLGSVLLLRRVAPKLPGALVAVIAAIAASSTLDFAGHGIATIGPVAGGLPHLSLSGLLILRGMSWEEVELLLTVSISCAVIILTQSAATSRIYAAKHYEQVSENIDLLGLSAANAASALSGGFVVNGSPTQTAMMELAGGQSQLAQVTTAFAVGIVLLFLTGPLQYLPTCVLGVVVFLVALHLIDLKGLREIRGESPQEYALAVMTAAVVLLVGVEQGIVLAMVLSLLRVVRHSYHPHSGVLVADGTGAWKLVPVAPNVATEPGLVLYRFGAALFYANAGRFLEEVSCVVQPMPSAVRWVVVDAEAMTHVDYTASRVVMQLKSDLTHAGIELAFARVPWDLRSDFDRHHLTETIGPARIFNRLHDAISAFEGMASESGENVGETKLDSAIHQVDLFEG